MPRPRISAQPMSPAERQARHRAMLRRPNDTQPELPPQGNRERAASSKAGSSSDRVPDAGPQQ